MISNSRRRRWLEANGVPATQALDVRQPVVVDGHAVTFWHELPEHRHGTPSEVATAIRSLHQFDHPTTFELPKLQPFVRLAKRIEEATVITEDDRRWLHSQRLVVQSQYAALPGGLPPAVMYGDAWAGNVVHTRAGELVFLDLERFSSGHRNGILSVRLSSTRATATSTPASTKSSPRRTATTSWSGWVSRHCGTFANCA
ncbi:MAG: phosphotransferase [Nocardioidaceae bacterium]